jgi:hypothetical protein
MQFDLPVIVIGQLNKPENIRKPYKKSLGIHLHAAMENKD